MRKRNIEVRIEEEEEEEVTGKKSGKSTHNNVDDGNDEYNDNNRHDFGNLTKERWVYTGGLYS